eukprot:comp17579_c0_seq1/m.17205 comp17579_c0_seq1/g.17205  ORF comp17579_c0_seq1/g.17205 comp17579_c0_seq1/m.17205 type:complete len:299 (-) comp17579_c0_seq1:501-1397(-)
MAASPVAKKVTKKKKAGKEHDGDVVAPQKQHNVSQSVPKGYVRATFEGKVMPKRIRDAQLWLFRVPVDFDASQLEGAEVDPGRTVTLTVDGSGKHAINPVPEDGAVEALGGISLWGAEGEGMVVGSAFAKEFEVTRAFDVPDPQQVAYPRPDISQPKGLKQRWKPFGAGKPVVSVGADNLKSTKKKGGKEKKEKKTVVPEKNWDTEDEAPEEAQKSTKKTAKTEGAGEGASQSAKKSKKEKVKEEVEEAPKKKSKKVKKEQGEGEEETAKSRKRTTSESAEVSESAKKPKSAKKQKKE